MEVCDECKAIEVCSCQSFCLAPDGGISGETDYIITITDKFGIKYKLNVTSNIYGVLCIDITGFAEGFFSPYGGIKIITIASPLASDEDIQFVYGSLNYTCIALSIKECETIDEMQVCGDYIDQTPDNGTYGLLVGDVNNVNTLYAVSRGSYTSGTLRVYLNGQLLTQGTDWVEVNPSLGTFSFVTAPFTGEVVTAIYN